MINYYLRKFIILTSFILIFSSFLDLYGQLTPDSYSIEDTISVDVDLFSEEEPAIITLSFSLKEFMKKKNSDKYIDARLLYHISDTLDIEKNIRIKARGNRRREICSFPPIWINLKKAKIDNIYLQDINKIKLVTHCVKNYRNFDYVILEYLIYKMYNIISPYSFRVRLARIKYVDTGRKNREFEEWGFLIEPEELMAERLDAYPLKLDNISYKYTDRMETDIMCLFQYLIGNADYSIQARQNVKLLKMKDPDKLRPIPVPYDFDYSGFVNAEYAIPGGNLGIEKVTERYFLGPCRSNECYSQRLDIYFDKKDEIYNLVNSSEHLHESSKRTAIKYLDEFFLQARNKNFIRYNFLTTCRDTI